MKRDCMFQYATRHRIYVNTGLITMDEAKKLFNKNKEDFLSRPVDEDAEMVLWINCKDDSSYGESLYYWIADDFIVVDGGTYQKI